MVVSPRFLPTGDWLTDNKPGIIYTGERILYLHYTCTNQSESSRHSFFICRHACSIEPRKPVDPMFRLGHVTV